MNDGPEPDRLHEHDVIMALGRFMDYERGIYMWLLREDFTNESPRWALVHKVFPYVVKTTLMQRFDRRMLDHFVGVGLDPALLICDGVKDVMACHFHEEASAIQFAGMVDVGAFPVETYNGVPMYKFSVLR